MKHYIHTIVVLIGGAILVTLAIILSGCSSTPPITVHGTEETTTGILSGETPESAFPDIASGGQVVVVSSTGAVIGTGTLGQAEVVDPGEVDYTFTVQVPGGLSRYGIRIGGSQRGTVWYSAAQMAHSPGLCVGDGC